MKNRTSNHVTTLRRTLYSELRQHLGEAFKELARQQESRVEEGHLARVYGEKKRSFVGQHFWARGYFVSTVGRGETVIREYIRNQENVDERLEQMKLWQGLATELVA